MTRSLRYEKGNEERLQIVRFEKQLIAEVSLMLLYTGTVSTDKREIAKSFKRLFFDYSITNPWRVNFVN
jgi:hypothetical protein